MQQQSEILAAAIYGKNADSSGVGAHVQVPLDLLMVSFSTSSKKMCSHKKSINSEPKKERKHAIGFKIIRLGQEEEVVNSRTEQWYLRKLQEQFFECPDHVFLDTIDNPIPISEAITRLSSLIKSKPKSNRPSSYCFSDHRHLSTV